MGDKEIYYSLIIVDDEEKIRNGLSRFGNWEAMGFKIAAVYEDGKEALDHLEREKVDAVLTDIRMSEVSGLELAEQIAAHYPETHLVIMSGYRDFDYAQQALRYEAFDYLLKPIEITQLAETFDKLGIRIREQQEMRHLKGLIPDIETLFRKRLRDNDSGIDSALQELPQNSRLTAEETAFLEGGEKEKTKYTYSIIHRVQRYVEENYQRDLTLSEIAETVFLSPVYFCRLFKELTGLNFLTYLTNHRMEKAKELLVINQYKIGEVGQLVGYNNTKYFTRVFKKHCGVTPSEYIHRELLDD